MTRPTISNWYQLCTASANLCTADLTIHIHGRAYILLREVFLVPIMILAFISRNSIHFQKPENPVTTEQGVPYSYPAM
jgi:hypothetical protein